MLSMKSVMKVDLNGKTYEFFCDPNSSLPDVMEAHSQIGAFLIGKQEQCKAALQQKVSENLPVQDNNPSPQS